MNVPIIDAGERRVTATVLDRREPDAEVLNSHITALYVPHLSCHPTTNWFAVLHPRRRSNRLIILLSKRL